MNSKSASSPLLSKQLRKWMRNSAPEALEGRIAPAAVLDILGGENSQLLGDASGDSTEITNQNADFTSFFNSGGLTSPDVDGVDVIALSAEEIIVRKTLIDGGTLTVSGGGGTDDLLLGIGLQQFDGLAVNFETVQALPDLTIGSAGLSVTATAGGVSSADDLNVTGITTITAAGAIVFNGTNNDFGGGLTLTSTAAGAITVTDNVGDLVITSASTSSGMITFTSNAGTVTLGNVTVSVAGDIFVNASDSVELSGTVTTPDDVSLIATNGAILDTNDNDKPNSSPVGGGITTDIVANSLTLDAASGAIGEDGDTLETLVSTLTATAGGGVYVWNRAALTVGILSAAGAGAPSVDITSEGSMTISGPVTQSTGESVTFFAAGAAANLTINGTVSGTGDMNFQAGNQVIIGGSGVINNTGSQTVALEAGWPDANVGIANNPNADLTLSGALNFASANLRLSAPRNVVLNGANADISTAGDLTIFADRDGSAVGTGGSFQQNHIGSLVQTGAVEITAADVQLVGIIDAASDNITVAASILTSPIYLNNAGVGLSLSITDLLSLRSVGGTISIGGLGHGGTVFIGGQGTVGVGLIDANYAIHGEAIDFNGGIVLHDDRTLTLNAGSGLITAAGGSVTDVTISGVPGTLAVNSSSDVTLNTKVTNLGPSVIDGDLVLNNANVSLTVSGDVDTISADINVGTGTFSVANTFTLNSFSSAVGNITLTADGIALDGDLVGGGTLTLRGSTVAATYGFGDGATGAFNMTLAEIANIQVGFEKIVIGRTGQTGDIHFLGGAGTEVTFLDSVQIIGGTSEITVEDAAIIGTGDAGFQINSKRLVFTGAAPGIVNNNAPINITSAVLLESDVTIDSTAGGMGGGTDGDMLFIGTINGAFDLNVTAGDGDIFFAGNPTPVPSGTSIGGDARLTSITVSGEKVTLHCNMSTSGDQTYTAGEIVMSNGNRSSSLGDINFNGPSTVTVLTRTSAPEGTITFNGSVNSGPSGAGALNLTADAINFNGAVGDVEPLASLISDVEGTLTFGDSFASDNLVVKVDEINFLGGPNSVAISGGNLGITVKTAGTQLRVGGAEGDLIGGAPTLNFSDDDIEALADGAGAISFSQVAAADLIVVAEASAVHFLDALTLNHITKGGMIQIKGELYGDTANGSITTKVGSGGFTVLEDSVFTTGGGNIDITNGRVSTDVTLDSSASGGDVTIRGKWDAAAGGENLIVNSGSGDITIIGSLGISSARPPVLGAVTLTSSGTTSLGTSLSADSLVVNGGGTTNLSGAVVTLGADGQTFGDAVVLTKSAGLTSKNDLGAIQFASTINSIPTKLNSLTVTNTFADPGTEVATFTGAIGATDRVGTFRINTKGDATVSGDIFAKGVSISAAEFSVQDVDTVIVDSAINSQIYRGLGTYNGTINSEALSITSTEEISNNATWTVSGRTTIKTDKDSDININNIGPANTFGELRVYGENILVDTVGDVTLGVVNADLTAEINTTGNINAVSVRVIDQLSLNTTGGNIIQTGIVKAYVLNATASGSIQLDSTLNAIRYINNVSSGAAISIATGTASEVGIVGTVSSTAGNIALASTRASFIYNSLANISVAGGFEWTIYTPKIRHGFFDLEAKFLPDATEQGGFPTPPIATGNVIVYQLFS